MRENTPFYLLCFIVAFMVGHGREWTTLAGIAYSSIMLLVNALYLYDVFPRRLSTSPLPFVDCLEATIYNSCLGW
jgi:hypothetical protein